MSIFWTKALAKSHFSRLALLGGFSVLFPSVGFSLDMSSPVGLQQIGQRLDLKSTVSNIPEGTESQLRATCMKAKYYSLESESVNPDFATGNEVLVNFDPTIRRGGLLELKSVSPVNSALIEVVLVSECPLVVFKTRWTLIMKQSGDKLVEPAASSSKSRVSSFDPKSSSLLASSRRPPSASTEKMPRWMTENPKLERETQAQKAIRIKKEIEKQQLAAQSKASAAAIDNAPIFTPPVDELVRTSLKENRTVTTQLPQSQGFGEYQTANVSANPVRNWALPALLGSSAVLMLFLIAYRSHTRTQSERTSENREEPQTDLVGKSREHTFAYSAEPTTIGSQRVLESLMGGDEPSFVEDLDSGVHATNLNGVDPVQRSSLTIGLELINRADIPSWSLPASYLDLVESRNRSLELHRTPEALVLRAHIGLVELAFQDAKQGLLTDAETSTEMLDQVLGQKKAEIESISNLVVPDVVKSHVRAKMCEIAGAEKRQLLRENLLNLNTQIENSALCFGSNAWREFLSEEGILD